MKGIEMLAAVSRRLPPLRGRGALGNFLQRNTKSQFDGLWSIGMRDGSVMEVPWSSAMGWVPAFTGRYDAEKIELILRFLDPDTVALDVGACFGLYAVPMGLYAASKDAQVIAFEALPANERRLRDNIARNHLSSVVTSVPIGLGRAAATVSMIVEAGGTGNAFVISKTLDEPGKTKVNEVRIERLDEVDIGQWTTKRRCSLIKMDIEGFELEALAGSEEFVRCHRPVIFGEFNGWFLERNGVAPTAVQEWAYAHDYRPFDLCCHRENWILDNFRVVSHLLGPEEVRAGGDLLLIPRERNDLEGRI